MAAKVKAGWRYLFGIIVIFVEKIWNKMRKLNHYSIEEVLEAFEIQPIDDCQILTDWINAEPTELSAFDKSLLKDLPTELQQNVRNWNEEELKMNRGGGPIY